MGRGCHSTRHRQFRDQAKTRVDDLQEMFAGLQSARRESRGADAAVLEAQVHQMLREWRAELNVPSPASSLQANSNGGDTVSETLRLLQLAEEDDDATSKLVEALPASQPNVKDEPEDPAKPTETQSSIHISETGENPQNAIFNENYYMNADINADDFAFPDHLKIHIPLCSDPGIMARLDDNSHLDIHQLNAHQNLHQEVPHDLFLDINNSEQNGGDGLFYMSDLLTAMYPQSSAYLRPKCAFWECLQPAHGIEQYHDYCHPYHADLALQEAAPGACPVKRPKGIELKDGPLFAAIGAKMQGKNVGIPVCEGAATSKSPWNAPELFDLCMLEGESIREWLFFDKPRRAFESGSRKQRSLPDYNGRGWHESRKQTIKEFKGLKRSYYMDPQPLSDYEWHLFEYLHDDSDAFALYRLEFKAAEPRKGAKAKVVNTSQFSLADLQQQMGKLSADNAAANKRSNRNKDSAKPAGSVPTASDQGNVLSSFTLEELDHMSFLNNSPVDENPVYGPNLPYHYSADGNGLFWNQSDSTLR